MSSNRNMNKNSFKFVVYEDELSDYQNDSDGLEIDECPSPRKKKSPPQLDSNEKAVLENIDKEIDKQLEEKAASTNMSAQNVKNILKHIITNEQVLALVRNSANDEPFRTENLTFEPKLTRAKVKELFKNQAPPIGQKSEVHILIDQELPEDEEDDEYIPGDDESDDDRSTLNQSDLDSQPATPATPSTSYSADCGTQTSWTDDGLFKVPTKPIKTPPTTPQLNKSQENIALRTRSKLSLSDTPLESIEQAFIPPDITTDMYDIACDDDDWTNFLKDFTLPLQAVTTAINEDDDETDPEYNILADEEIDAVDKEELRADRGVKVTKRELNDLVAELFDFADLFTPPCPNDTTEENEKQPNTTENITNNDKPPTPQTNTNAEIETSTVNVDQSLSPCNVINNDQILLVQQQIRQHVQLVTQHFMQSCKHPIYSGFTDPLKKMMYEIVQEAKKNSKSVLNSLNLKNSVRLINFWEQKVESNDTDTQEMMQFVNTQLRKYTAHKKLNKVFLPKLSPLLLKTIAKSDVFIYPYLLPRVPFLPVVSVSNRIYYISEEDALIAIGLEQFMGYLSTEKILKHGKPSIIDACQLIVRFLMPCKEYLSMRTHIISLKNGTHIENPINYYFKHKEAPQTTHYVVFINECIPVYKHSKDLLHEPWRSYIYPEPKITTLEQIKPFISDNSTQLRVPIPSLKNYNKSNKTRIPRRRRKKSKLLEYIKFKPVLLKNNTSLNITDNENKTTVFRLKSNSLLSKFGSNTFIMLPSMPGLSPFKHISTSSTENVESGDNTTIVEPSTSLDLTSDTIKNIDIPKNTEKKIVKNTPETSIQDEKKGKETEISTPVKGSSTIKTKPKITASEKKKAKQQKEYETVRALLSPENPNVTEEKANNYAQAYFNKVKERLTQNSPEDYNLFLATLSDHSESSDSVTDLYSKVTAILSPKHPDLCEEFITFLTPAQAKEIEKLIPYCMLSRMATFLRKLETYYSKQPAQIRKIYNSLIELSGQESVSMDLIKSTIVPLLKGNSYLIDYFLQIFSEEKPPQSLMTVWEDVDCEMPSNKNVQNPECFENLKVPDSEDPYGSVNCICSCHTSSNEEYSSRNRHCVSCGTKFIQGKVFIQTGKGPRPVSVTFPDCSMEEQSKRLSITHKSRSKRRSEIPNKTTPFSPIKQPHNEFEEDEHFNTRSAKNSPKKMYKSPKTNSARKKSRKPVDSRKGEKEETKKGEVDTVTQKKCVKSNLGFASSKKDVPTKCAVSSKADTAKSENEIESPTVTTVDNDVLKKIDKNDQQDPLPMEWDDCNVSVESIELKLSPNRSVESSDLCEESSQDLSEGNEDIPATCSESENDSIVEAESIHSESSSSDNQEVSKQISFGWTRDEDKVILKTFQQECDSENTFDIIGELLPHRTIHEIRERFQTLMNLLLKITKSN